MKVTIEFPDVIAADLAQKWHDIPRRILEAVAMDGYRRGDLTTFQVGEMLGLHTKTELREAFQEAGIEIETRVERVEDEDPGDLLRKAQEAGILDAEGRRVRTELPTDMQPHSTTTFEH